MSEAEKKRLFLQAREDIRPVPKPTASATPRPKPRPASTPEPTPRSTPRPTPEPEETPLRKKPAHEPEETPRPKKPAPEPEATQRAKETPDVIDVPDHPVRLESKKPKPTPKPKSTPDAAPSDSRTQIPKGKTPKGVALDAPIHVEKSGLEKEVGMEPAPKSSFGGFFKRYRYLTPSIRRAIDKARVRRGRWKYIIVHNSGTRQGNARIFDVYHRRVRKMQNGLAYHFVIGNGNSSGNGEIEIGNRWTRQINGGHVASDYLNDISLGICLVGDLNRDKPTPQQMEALDELITYLRSRVGKIKGKSSIVLGHKEINPKPTDCPGDRFDLRWLHKKFR
jgi:hypothetical protein